MEEEHSELAAPALITLHPFVKSVIVAVGAELRGFDLSANSAITFSTSTDSDSHHGPIRSIKFDSRGRVFASAGDDKLVKVWDAEGWKCQKTIHAEKKVSAVTFSRDGTFVIFADKFGVVWITTATDENTGSDACKAKPLLAHCCSIITGLEVSLCGKFLATSDRDFKIRVSVLPKDALNGAHEIQCFCLGHKSFVSCISFLGPQAEGYLVSGGGDATVRLWNYISGELLDTLDIKTSSILKTEEVGLREHAYGTNDSTPAVTDLAILNGSVVAIAIERFAGIVIVSCSIQSKHLALLQRVSFSDGFIPRFLGFDGCNLWTIMGAVKTSQPDGTVDPEPNPPAMANAASITCVKVTKILLANEQIEIDFLEGDAVPGGARMLQTLQGDNTDLEAVKAATEQANTAFKNLLLRKEYSTETREYRKKRRNDKKSKNQR